jgi:hypothetical protein
VHFAAMPKLRRIHPRLTLLEAFRVKCLSGLFLRPFIKVDGTLP